jgi:hypothetical protein
MYDMIADIMMPHLGFQSTSGDPSIFICYKRGLTSPITKVRISHSHDEASSLARRGYVTLLLPLVRRPGRARPVPLSTLISPPGSTTTVNPTPLAGTATTEAPTPSAPSTVTGAIPTSTPEEDVM